MNLEKKKPNELTDEEMYELVNQIAEITFARKPAAGIIAEPADCAHDMLTYMYDKSARGKVGINEIKENTFKHFTNILYQDCMNTVNYELRKKKVQRFLNNTVSLQEPVCKGGYPTDAHYEDIIEGENNIAMLEEDIYVNQMLEKFSDIQNDKLDIRLDIGRKKYSLSFSYKNLARTYLHLFKGKKLTFRDFQGVFVYKDTKIALNDKEIRNVLTDFRSYIKQNNLLGGELTW